MAGKKVIGIIAAIVIVGGIIVGGIEIKSHAPTKGSTKVAQEQGFTVTDSTGQKVHFTKQPEKIVCLDSDAYNLITMLGEQNKVVGVSKMMSTMPNAKGKAVAGTWQDPNVTEILSLKADVVFAYAQYTNKKAVQELEAAGVKVVYINGDNVATLENDVTATAQIVGNTAKAKEFNVFASKYLNLVKETVDKIPANKRVNAYVEEYGAGQTAGKGSATQAFLDAAGINNIAADKGQFATVDPTWILAQNPDMVLKIETDGMGVLGEGVKNTAKAEQAYKELVSRTGWSDLKAVKDNNVHLIDNNSILSDTDIIPGILYAAKWAYPEQFKNVNPEQIQQQMQKEFYGKVEPGTYVYSGPTSK
ncbi:MAG: ABC transporter substrate-binding protein [Sarcina sp.]